MTKSKSTKKQNKKKSTKKKVSMIRKSTRKQNKKKSTKKRRKTSDKKKKSTKKKRKSTKKKTNNKSIKKKKPTKKKATKKKETKKSSKKKSSKKYSKKKPKKNDSDDDDDDDNVCGFQKMTNLMVANKVEKLKEMDSTTRKDIMKSELKLAQNIGSHKKKETVDKFNNAYKHSKCKKWVVLTIYLNIYEYHSACSEYTDPILDIYINNGIKIDILNAVAEYAKKKDEFILYGLIKEKLKKQTGGSVSVFENKSEPGTNPFTESESVTRGSNPFTASEPITGGSNFTDSEAIEKEIDYILGGSSTESYLTENIAEAGVVNEHGKIENKVVVGGISRSDELQEAGLDDYLEKLENHKIDTALQKHYGGSNAPPSTPSPQPTTSTGGSFSSAPSTPKQSYDDIHNSSIMGGYGETNTSISNPTQNYPPENHPATPSYDYNMDGGGKKEEEEEEVEPTDEEYYTDKVKIINEEFNSKSYDTLDRKGDELSVKEMDEFIKELIKYDIDLKVLRGYWRTIKNKKVQNLIINNPKIYPR